MQYTDRLNIIYEPPVTLREQPAEGRYAPLAARHKQPDKAGYDKHADGGANYYCYLFTFFHNFFCSARQVFCAARPRLKFYFALAALSSASLSLACITL